MNKTIRTIAWICLVLGIMGLLLDAGIILYLGRVRAERQAAIEAGELPYFRGAPQSGTLEGEVPESSDQDDENDNGGVLPQPGFIPRARADRMRSILQGRRSSSFLGAVPGRTNFHLPFLPLFFFGAGPVLAVIGAVTLIVNREPAKPKLIADSEEKKEKKKDSKNK